MAVVEGEGYAVGNLDEIGEGWGFRKIRRELGVKEFGVNAVVVPAGYEAGWHYHKEQEELYFCHRGTVELDFGDGTTQRLEEGGLARVDPATRRRIRNPGDVDAVCVVVGAKDGYRGRDGVLPEGETSRFGSSPPPPG